MKNFLVISICLLFFAGLEGQVITVLNPSFEGSAASSVSPPNWTACGGSPDTQPPWWGVSLPASNGSTYYGLVYPQSIPSSQESGRALTSTPLMPGTVHNMTVDLANLQAYNGSWNGNCIARLWGGTGCTMSQILWSSPQLTNSTWNTHNVSFTPTSAWTSLIWQVVIGTGTFSSLGVDNMSQITTIILDVKVSDFQAEVNQGQVDLSWVAEGDHEDTRYYIERARSGQDFSELGMIQGQNTGKEASRHDYSDLRPEYGTSWYRLHTVDRNGEESWSPIVEVTVFDPSGLSFGYIMPNPIIDQANLNILAESARLAEIQLLDSRGRMVHQQQVMLDKGENQLNLDFSGFQSGIYFVKMGAIVQRVVVGW